MSNYFNKQVYRANRQSPGTRSLRIAELFLFQFTVSGPATGTGLILPNRGGFSKDFLW